MRTRASSLTVLRVDSVDPRQRVVVQLRRRPVIELLVHRVDVSRRPSLSLLTQKTSSIVSVTLRSVASVSASARVARFCSFSATTSRASAKTIVAMARYSATVVMRGSGPTQHSDRSAGRADHRDPCARRWVPRQASMPDVGLPGGDAHGHRCERATSIQRAAHLIRTSRISVQVDDVGDNEQDHRHRDQGQPSVGPPPQHVLPPTSRPSRIRSAIG